MAVPPPAVSAAIDKQAKLVQQHLDAHLVKDYTTLDTVRFEFQRGQVVEISKRDWHAVWDHWLTIVENDCRRMEDERKGTNYYLDLYMDLINQHTYKPVACRSH